MNLISEGIRNQSPNYSLIYLSGYYKQHGKHIDRITFCLIDENTGQFDTLNAILSEDPDIVAISATSMLIDRAEALVRALKKQLPRLTVIGGGVHFHIYPEYLLREGVFDYTCSGEGEETFCRFLDTFVDASGSPSKTDLRQINGLNFMGGETIHSSLPDLISVESLPDPDLDIVDEDYYFRRSSNVHSLKMSRMAPVYTSRGCPYRCTFCYNELGQGTVRFLSADRVLNLMHTYIQRYKTNFFGFGDDLFIANKKRLYEICTQIIDQKLGIQWLCNGRADILSPKDTDLLALMRRAGCVQMQFGFESGSDRIVKMLKGGKASAQNNQEALDRVTAAGIDVMGYFIIGLPDETPEDLQATVNFIYHNRHKMYHWEVFIFTPIPGTYLWDVCKDKGLLEGMNFSELGFNMVTNDKNKIRIFSDTLTLDEIYSTKLHLKNILYRKVPLSKKAIWALSQVGSNPGIVWRTFTHYLRGLCNDNLRRSK